MTSNKLHSGNVRLIVVHCSATPPHMDIGVKEIDRWHRQRGWFCCGYHLVINRAGELEHGRRITTPGAHARGYNHESISICLVGGVNDNKVPEDNFNEGQMLQLEELINELRDSYPSAVVIGHNELNRHKACPSFDVQQWVRDTWPESIAD